MGHREEIVRPSSYVYSGTGKVRYENIVQGRIPQSVAVVCAAIQKESVLTGIPGRPIYPKAGQQHVRRWIQVDLGDNKDRVIPVDGLQRRPIARRRNSARSARNYAARRTHADNL